MKRKSLISPSILSADFVDLKNEIKKMERAGADALHLDVMDGHFVPNITIGPGVVQAVNDFTDLALDVHLMIDKPDAYTEHFIEAGADYLAVHTETTRHLHKILASIKKNNCRAGVAFNPATPPDSIREVLNIIDFVVIMTVNPGFGGQDFIPESYEKIKRIRRLLDESENDVLIQVDGGVGKNNLEKLSKAGVDMFVSGSGVFGSDDPVDTVKDMKRILEDVN